MRSVMFFILVILSGCTTLTAQGSASETQPSISTETQIELAGKAFSDGDHEKALTLYKEVIAKENWNRKANYNISVIHLELAIKGFEFVGQFIDNPTDASIARKHLDDAIENVQKYLSVSQNYVRSN